MGDIRRVFFVFGFLSLVFFVPTETSAQQSCGQMATCAQGQYGPGGCYRPHRQDCFGGLICSKTMRFCPAGSNGSGGCYLPGSSTCSNGLICPSGMRVCNAGPNGPGGCFKLNYAQCFDGLICEPGMKPCNDAQGPRCVRIGTNLCNRPTQPCPTGMRQCQPGPNGPGGCFKLNYASCFSGLICSSGMKVCKDSLGTRCYKPGYGQCGSSATRRPFSPSPLPTPAPRSTQPPRGGWNVIQ